MIAFALLIAAAMAQDRQLLPAPNGDGIATITVTPHCDRDAEEITVCGNVDPSRFPLAPLPDRYREPPIRSTVRLPGGGSGGVEAAERCVGGFCAPAAMVTLKIPFGRGRKKPSEDK